MDCLEAIFGRRSCRNFTDQPVEKEKIIKILESAIYAPSADNEQPWEFIVTNNTRYNKRLRETSEITKMRLAERSGWKWLSRFKIDFVEQAPVLIVVVGDPSKNGAEQFMDEPAAAYRYGCCAAVQNMMLAAHSLGLATVWFSIYEKSDVRSMFDIPREKDPLAIICLGYAGGIGAAPARIGLEQKVRFLD